MNHNRRIKDDHIEEPYKRRAEYWNRCKNTDDSNERRVGNPTEPKGLHGCQSMNEYFRQKNEEKLLKKSRDNPMGEPPERLNQIYNISIGVKIVFRDNIQQNVGKRNSRRNNDVIEKSAPIEIDFFPVKVHDFLKVDCRYKNRRKNSRGICVITRVKKHVGVVYHFHIQYQIRDPNQHQTTRNDISRFQMPEVHF